MTNICLTKRRQNAEAESEELSTPKDRIGYETIFRSKKLTKVIFLHDFVSIWHDCGGIPPPPLLYNVASVCRHLFVHSSLRQIIAEHGHRLRFGLWLSHCITLILFIFLLCFNHCSVFSQTSTILWYTEEFTVDCSGCKTSTIFHASTNVLNRWCEVFLLICCV